MLWPLFKKQEGLESLEFIFSQAVPTTPTASHVSYLPDGDADTEKSREDTAGGGYKVRVGWIERVALKRTQYHA